MRPLFDGMENGIPEDICQRAHVGVGNGLVPARTLTCKGFPFISESSGIIGPQTQTGQGKTAARSYMDQAMNWILLCAKKQNKTNESMSVPKPCHQETGGHDLLSQYTLRAPRRETTWTWSPTFTCPDRACATAFCPTRGPLPGHR